MKHIDWTEAERLFHNALEAPEEQRAAILAGAAPELRETVERLLRQVNQDERIARLIQSAAALATQPAGRVGAYRLVKEIGAGGMGAVYLAVRADDVFEKKVAVKFVRRGMDSPALRSRFQDERRILARLEHPSIARLLDGGATADGQPYLVMEYVEGENIVSYAGSRQLPERARLELFIEVCAAVQYAHQNLVVHRDLKPANIWVDPSGHPKLLDFGIARLIDSDSTQPQGITLMRVMTPDYASPEQLRGESVSTASDIYSLGAVLYELICGERPSRESAARLLGSDLDNIVKKAMREDPPERYATVAELAGDVRRYCAGEPVLARDYTAAARFIRLVRRNRATSIATAAALTLLIAGAAITAREAVVARRERANAVRQRGIADRQRGIAEQQRAAALKSEGLAETRAAEAQQERQRAERRTQEERDILTRFVQDFYAKMMDLPGSTAARQSILEAGVPLLENLRREAPDDMQVADALALGYMQMGQLLGSPTSASKGDLQKGMAFLLKGRSLLELVIAHSPRDFDKLTGLARIDIYLARFSYFIDPTSGDTARHSEQAIAAARKALALAPADANATLILADTYSARARYRIEQHSDGPVSDLDEATQLISRARDRGVEEILWLNRMGDLESLRARFETVKGDRRAALPHFEATARFREELASKAPNDSQALRLALLSQSYLGNAYRALEGKNSRHAIAAYERMAALAEKLAAADPLDRTAKYDLAMAMSLVSDMKRDSGDLEAALWAAERSVKSFRDLGANLDVSQRRNMAGVLISLGKVYEAMQRMEDAKSAWREGLTQAEAVLEKTPRDGVMLQHASSAAAFIGSATAGKESRQMAEQAVAYAEQAWAVLKTPAAKTKLARAQGEAALALDREGLRDRARELARLSVQSFTEFGPQELADWSPEHREKIKAVANAK